MTILSSLFILFISCSSAKHQCKNKALNFPECTQCPEGMIYLKEACHPYGLPLSIDKNTGKPVPPTIIPKK